MWRRVRGRETGQTVLFCSEKGKFSLTNLVGLVLKGLPYLSERGISKKLVIETLLRSTVEKPHKSNNGKLYFLEKNFE